MPFVQYTNILFFADGKDMKKFHDAMKTIYAPTLLSADGSTQLLS